MAELHAIYGELTFTTTGNRDRAVAQLELLSAAQGFQVPTDPPFPDYPMGMTKVGQVE